MKSHGFMAMSVEAMTSVLKQKTRKQEHRCSETKDEEARAQILWWKARRGKSLACDEVGALHKAEAQERQREGAPLCGAVVR